MAAKKLKLSIVIPVYNEEDYLKDCLESIATQTIKPFEVIVVDNNSTDNSVKIAESYSFVKLWREPKQHQVFAQATGFNAANGDILGRIDADSILPKDWTAKIIQAFEDPRVVAATGGANPYDAPARRTMLAGFYGYLFGVRLIVGHRILWGANCAIKTSAWRKIRREVLMRPDIWEDYDASFCLAQHGQIYYLHHNNVGASFRAVHNGFLNHVRYQFRAIRTFYYRANLLQLLLFCLLWTTTLITYPIMAADDRLLRSREAKRAPEDKA